LLGPGAGGGAEGIEVPTRRDPKAPRFGPLRLPSIRRGQQEVGRGRGAKNLE
jgi:hypothetical protein